MLTLNQCIVLFFMSIPAIVFTFGFIHKHDLHQMDLIANTQHVCVILSFMYYGGLSSSLQLSADADGVFVNNRLVMECRTSTPTNSVNWLLLKNNSGFENVIVVHEFVNNICLATGGRDTVECFCNSSTVFTCAIKAIHVSNDDDRWRCSTPVNGFTTYSNTITITIRITLNSLTFFPRPVAAVSYPIYNTTSAFTCITSQSSPATSIHWFEDGVNITKKSNYHFSSYIATSVIEYAPKTTSIKHLSCVATYTYKNISINLVNGTNIQIQYPVSKPVIVMNTKNVSETIHIRENELLEFRCASSGYPSPSYSWAYPGGNATGNAVELYFDRFSNENFITCTAINVLFLLNGSTSIKSTAHAISIKMNVSYSPSFKHFVHKNGSFNVSDLRVIKGDNMTITCEWDANPPAIVFWQGQSNNSSALSVTNIQKDVTFTCHAFNFILDANGLEKQGNATVTLSILVLYGPSVPTVSYSLFPNLSIAGIVPSNSVISLIEGSSVWLICSTNSNPTSIFTWGQGFKSAVLNISNISRTNVSITCTAENTMNTILRGNVTESKQTTIRVDVLYGPENMSARYNNMQIHQVLKVIDGSSFEISCSASSNPASVIHWLGPVEQMGDVLSINDVSKDWDWNITCIARNTMVDSIGHSESKLAKLTVFLDVLYPPIADQNNNQTALLDSSFTITCNLYSVGNPPATNYTWFRKHSGSIFGTTQQLIINKIALTDEGEYRCNATNLMQPVGKDVVYGFSQATVYVDVQYKATVRSFQANESQSKINIDEGETVEMVCDASGDPTPLVRIINTTSVIALLLLEKEDYVVTYFIHRARCEYDRGVYKCLAHNYHNIEQNIKTLDVYINCSPRPSPFSPSTHDLYRAPNESAEFSLTIIAYPEQFDDYTVYMLDVSNAFGSTAEIFTLHAKSIPDVPTGFHVIRVENNAIDIAWIPGFDGGEVQNFTIRYKEVHSENWKNVYVSSSDLNHTWTLVGLKPNTTYAIKLLAENKIGKSGWTEEITKTTLMGTNTETEDNAVKVDSVSLLSAVGGAVGGLVVVVIIVVSILIWRYRLTGKTDAKTGQTGPYDQLAIDVRSNDASLTEGSYATCTNDSSATQHANTYEILAETELHGYSSLSPFGMQRESTLTSGCFPRMAANVHIVPSSHDLEYENMKL